MMFNESDIFEALETTGNAISLEYERCPEYCFSRQFFLEYVLEYNERYELVEVHKKSGNGTRKIVKWFDSGRYQGRWCLSSFIDSHRSSKYNISYSNNSGKKISSRKVFSRFWIETFIPTMKEFCLKKKLERELQEKPITNTRRTKI